jgi:hypothetical protein
MRFSALEHKTSGVPPAATGTPKIFVSVHIDFRILLILIVSMFYN